jgi:hypothetical protein
MQVTNHTAKRETELLLKKVLDIGLKWSKKVHYVCRLITGLSGFPHTIQLQGCFVAHGTGVRRLALVFALAGSLASAAFAFNVSFSKVAATPAPFGGPHADLNSDGREDFVGVNNVTGSFDVALSTGDGKYAAPVPYSLPGGADARIVLIGDFNGDGKADLLVGGEQDNALHLFLNNGLGGFSQKAVFPNWVPGDFTSVVGDFNHDGRMDVAFVGPSDMSVTVWFGNGKGGFTVGPTSPLPAGEHCDNHMQMGDFDGDGRADLICDAIFNLDEKVLYGDGTGRFPASSLVPLVSNYTGFYVADVDGDGKSDVLLTLYNPTVKNISVRYGSATRKWTRTSTTATLHFAQGVTAADINGDGINDLIVGEVSAGLPNTATYYVGVLLRNSNRSYQKEQTVLTGNVFFDYVIRANRDPKPDLLVNNFVLLNTTTGNFPSCAPPNAFEGINVCSPVAGATVTSPVSFKAGAAGPVPMRDMEVWVDGKKVALQVDGFSNYTFLNRSVSLSAGWE